MQLDKLKGTLVDFNQLEHVLDDAEHIGGWQLELRKHNGDALETDELVLHVHKTDSTDEESLKNELSRRMASRTEVRPNSIVFHDYEEMKRLLGVGTRIKEQRIVDRRSVAETDRIAKPRINGSERNPTAAAVLK